MKKRNDPPLSNLKMPHLVKVGVPKIVTCSDSPKTFKVRNLANKTERGFSLIELLLVVVTIGVIAAIAVPRMQQTIRMAESGNTFSTMRTISSTQISYFSTNSRFARLTELNNMLSGSLGSPSGNEVIRGKFVLSMTPAAPTDLELKSGYTITATRNVTNDPIIYVYELTQSGEIRQILP